MGNTTITLAVLLSACGDNLSELELILLDRPVYFAYRTSDGNWREPELTHVRDGEYHYRLILHQEAEIVAVCDRGDGYVNTQQLFLTDDDAGIFASSWPYPSCHTYSRLPVTSSLTGSMIQPGRVGLASNQSVLAGSGNWQFHFDVAAGLLDLVALSAERVLIRHDQHVVVGKEFVESIIDLDSEGSLLVSSPVDVSRIDTDEQPAVDATFSTRHGTQIQLQASTKYVTTFPPEVVLDGDIEILSVELSASNSFRTATVLFGASPSLSVQMLPRLDGEINFETSAVSSSWNSLPADYTSITVAYGELMVAQSVTASHEWISRHSASRLTFDENIPHYQTEWNVVPSISQRTFAVEEAFDSGHVKEHLGTAVWQ